MVTWKCWGLKKSMEKKYVRSLINEKGERVKGVYIRAKWRETNNLEGRIMRIWVEIGSCFGKK